MKKQKLIQNEETIIGTEQKIIDAALRLFQSKGFAGTRTRDIAAEAGINLALLNYYFRSKEKLFEIILLQTMSEFMEIMKASMNNEFSTFEQKVDEITDAYHLLLSEKPSIPLFVLSELSRGNHTIVLKATGLKKIYQKSVFAAQYQEAIEQGKYVNRPLIWLVTNLMSLTIFPFMATPLLQLVGDMNQKENQRFLQSRKEFVTSWILQTLQK